MKYTDLFDVCQFNKFKNDIMYCNDYMEFSQSTAILKNSINCFPYHPGLYYLLALTYFKSNEYIKGSQCFEKGIKYDQKSNRYLGLISCILFQINDIESSYSYACKALELDKNNIDAIITLGNIELIRNNYEESLSYGVMAIEIEKSNFRAIRLLSKIYIAMGIDDEDTLKILYRARESGKDYDIDLDIIKILFLTERDLNCLKECRDALINNCTGYTAGKITKYVGKIYERTMKTQSVQTQAESISMLSSGESSEASNVGSSKFENSSTNKAVRNRFVENIENMITTLESRKCEDEKTDSKKESISYDEKDKENNNDNNAFHDPESNENSVKDDNKVELKKSESHEESTRKSLHGRERTGKNKEERKSESLEEALNKLNNLIGLEGVKKEIDRIVRLIKYAKNRNEILNIDKEPKLSYHFAFLGNPGTGKTTVARLIGDIFYYLGILEKGHIVEVDRSDIVGRFIGETAKLTKKAIDKAMGGILFIDEAYSLAKGGENSNDYGKEAIETLLKAMEDNRGKFTVIFAGYTKEMKNLINMNPGLQSRINLMINFDDYSDDELTEIAESIAHEEYYKLSEDGKKAFVERISHEKVDENFANARAVRNLIEEAVREKAFRTGDETASEEELTTLTSEDFGVDLSFTARDNVKKYENELENLVGLEDVKKLIKNILDNVELIHRKKEMGIKCEDISLNMIFSGNPGTGKTTVARIVGKILKAMGILKKGHMVEVTRSDLVGQYVGQTGPKTLAKIKEAYGGILFIDEAYSLNSGSESDFGSEAIATLIKEMEDNRDKLIVIMAGYTKEMKELMNVNPGLESRIKFNIEFNDYSGEELFKIFRSLCKKEKYKISHNAYKKLKEDFDEIAQQKGRNFGNGRLVRKYFENIKMTQATRIIRENINDKEEILKITIDDIIT